MICYGACFLQVPSLYLPVCEMHRKEGFWHRGSEYEHSCSSRFEAEGANYAAVLGKGSGSRRAVHTTWHPMVTPDYYGKCSVSGWMKKTINSTFFVQGGL